MIKKYKDGTYEGEGTFLTKKRHGKGKMTYLNGEIYEGEWENDVRSGEGELYKPKLNGKAYSYLGTWQNGLLNGKGRYKNSDTEYEGDFKDGKYDGNGVLKKKNPRAIIISTYNGQFKNGLKHGQGTEITNEYTYVGEFSGDKIYGNGKKTLINGDFFDGSFTANIFKSGKGKITYGDNSVYEGKLTGRVPDGRGKITFEDGRVMVGSFKSGKKQGKFSVTLPNGEKYTEEYNDNVLISADTEPSEKQEEKKEEKKKSSADKQATKENKDAANKGAEKAEAAKETAKKSVKKTDGKATEQSRKAAKLTKKTATAKSVSAKEKKPSTPAYARSPEIEAAYRNAMNAAEKAMRIAAHAESQSNKAKELAKENLSSYSFNSQKLIKIESAVAPGFDTYKGNITNGFGIYTWADGERYEGEWKNSEREGLGVFYYKGGDVYAGEILDSKIVGSGVCVLKNGTTYKGNFHDGYIHGSGVLTLSNGEKYVGDFSKNERSGYGIFYSNESQGRYVGQFVNGEFTGFGVLYANGKIVYEGQFSDGKFHGKGVYTWADGDTYEGDFVDGECTGKGIHTWQNGDKYEGDFVDGELSGEGTLTYADGTVEQGKFEKGEFISGNTAVKAEEEKPKAEPQKEKSQITFEDVAGLNEVKEQIKFHVLEPMKNPELARAYGIKPGGKILLYGPPGTGKTLVARAIAGEIDAEFFAVSCQDLISKWLGESSERLNNLFDEVEKHEKAIVFFDEFDSIAGKRDSANESKEIARFVATFLTRVDGFKPTQNKMLLLIAATNRPWALDSAMLRGGRFDTQIYVGTPDKEAREFMVNKSLGKLPLGENVNLNELAMRLEGFGGGDITAICDKIGLEAYKKSVKLGKMQGISLEDVETVLKSVKNSISKEELEKFEAYKNGKKINN